MQTTLAIHTGHLPANHNKLRELATLAGAFERQGVTISYTSRPEELADYHAVILPWFPGVEFPSASSVPVPAIAVDLGESDDPRLDFLNAKFPFVEIISLSDFVLRDGGRIRHTVSMVEAILNRRSQGGNSVELSTANILVVDDEEALAGIAVQILGSLTDAPVSFCKTLAKARPLALEANLLFLDGGRDGYGATDKFARELLVLPKPPLVFRFTGSPDDVEVTGSGFFAKPPRSGELVNRLQAIVHWLNQPLDAALPA